MKILVCSGTDCPAAEHCARTLAPCGELQDLKFDPSPEVIAGETCPYFESKTAYGLSCYMPARTAEPEGI